MKLGLERHLLPLGCIGLANTMSGASCESLERRLAAVSSAATLDLQDPELVDMEAELQVGASRGKVAA